MKLEKLTLQHVEVQAVLVPLNRPVVSRVGTFEEWPLILIDLHTHEGVVGHSYLAPYLRQSVAYLVPAIHDLARARQDQPLAPIDAYQGGRKSLSLVGLEGMSLIAVSGLDMAVWDALAKAAGLPLATLLGGSLAPVSAYNSNGLWLTPLDTLAEEAAALVEEGGFSALKLRLGREFLDDDLTAISNVREGAGDEIKLMCDFNQGLSLGDALVRCQDLDGEGLYWFEEPIAYNNLTGYARLTEELATPVQLGENFYGPRALYEALQVGAGDYYMPDLMRIGGVTGWMRAAAIAGVAGIELSSHLYPEVSAHLLRVSESAHWLEWQDWADPILAQPFQLQDGHLVIPEVPGNGLAWDADAVARYRFEP